MPVTGSKSATLQLIVQGLAWNQQYCFKGKVWCGYICQKTDFAVVRGKAGELAA